MDCEWHRRVPDLEEIEEAKGHGKLGLYVMEWAAVGKVVGERLCVHGRCDGVGGVGGGIPSWI